MHLCIIRHAIAEERGLKWPDDDLRPLTDEGRAKMREAARGLMSLWQPEAIVTSPLVRAVQTAEIIAEVSGAPVVARVDGLANGDHEHLFRAVNATGVLRVAAVGHEPLTGEALSYALTGDDAAVSAMFKKGAAALIGFTGEARAGRGWLEWHLQPAALRALGK